MSTIGRAEPEGTAALAQSGEHSLDQVREILFGTQHRDFARRLARTEAHIATQAEELRGETRRRLDLLEAHIQKESDALTVSLESQRAIQVDALGKIARESREAGSALEQRVQRLEEAIARAQRDFRQQLLDQAKSFIEEIRRVRDELNTAVRREIATAMSEAPEMGAPAEGAYEEPDRREQWDRSSEAA